MDRLSSSDGRQTATPLQKAARIFATANELAERLKPLRDRPNTGGAMLSHSALLYLQIKSGLTELQGSEQIPTDLAAALRRVYDIMTPGAEPRSSIASFAEYLARSDLSEAAQRGLRLLRLEPMSQAATPEGICADEDFSHTVSWAKRLEESPGELVRLLRIWDDVWNKQRACAETWRDLCDSESEFLTNRDYYLDGWDTLTVLIISWCEASHPSINTRELLNLIELYKKWSDELFGALYLVDYDAVFKGDKNGVRKRRVTTAMRLKIAKINSRFEAAISEIEESVCQVNMRLETLAMAKMGAKKESEEPIEWTEPRSPDQWEQLYQVSWKTLRRRIDCGIIRAQRINSKSYRFNCADLPTSP